MFIIQCTLISVLCYFATNSCPLYGFTVGSYILNRPLIGGFLVGLILGDLESGIAIGVALQIVFLTFVTPGGAFPADLGFIAYPAIAIAIQSNMEVEMAVALGTTIGVIGTFERQVYRTASSFYASITDKHIANANYGGITRWFVIIPQLTLFSLRFIPSFVAIYFGADVVSEFIAVLPTFVTTGLNALGSILPAVGVATLLSTSVRNNVFILFFLVGFVLSKFLNLNIIALTIVAGALAYLYYRSGNQQQTVVAAIKDEEEVL